MRSVFCAGTDEKHLRELMKSDWSLMSAGRLERSELQLSRSAFVLQDTLRSACCKIIIQIRFK